MNHTATSGFRKLCFSTLVAVYFLIFIGGLVRSTGSGMGCPDWPKCFGSFIPPTAISQLPPNYKEHYSAYRDKKNQRFASFLKSIGQEETAIALLNDPQVRLEGDFNPVKTMIEYVNRLIGALIGIMLTALFIYSFRQPPIYRLFAGLSWLMVLITGWFGSIVVSTNLTPWTVTIHLGLAFLIVLLLSAAHAWPNREPGKPALLPAHWIWLAGILLVSQIFMGTTVRSEVDVLAASGLDRSEWANQFGSKFLLHRTFSWAVLAAFIFISWLLIKRTGNQLSSFAPAALILSLMLTGAVLNYLGMPWMIQPVHLLLATLSIGVLLGIGLKTSQSNS